MGTRQLQHLKPRNLHPARILPRRVRRGFREQRTNSRWMGVWAVLQLFLYLSFGIAAVAFMARFYGS